MKKTLNISIAKRLFNLEEDAYQKLDEYLSAIKEHFQNSPDRSEIITDIEERIAEHFLESKTGIITLQDVESLMQTMGTVEQFGEETFGEESPEKPKRLYRDSDDTVIAGVASGVSHYFGLDPVILRIVFAISVFLGGTGALIYVVLWLVMSEAKTASQKLAMRGDPINLETLSETARDRINEIKQKDMSSFRKVITLPFRIIGKIVQFILRYIPPFLRNIFGTILTTISILLLVAIIVGTGFFTSGDILMFENVTLQDFIPGFMRHSLTFSLGLILAIPALFMLFGGLSLFKKKGAVTSSVMFSLLGLWFVALSVSGFGIAKVANQYESLIASSPAYQETTRSLAVNGKFNSLKIQNGIRVDIIQGTTTAIFLEGKVRDVETLKGEAINGVLTIERDRSNEKEFCFFCHATRGPLKVTLTVKDPVETIAISHGSSLQGSLPTSSLLNLEIENGSRATLAVTTQNIAVKILHGSELTLTGTSRSGTFDLENGSRLSADKLTIRNATTTSIHGSRANLNVTETFYAIAENGSIIYYVGNPSVTKEERHGSRIGTQD